MKKLKFGLVSGIIGTITSVIASVIAYFVVIAVLIAMALSEMDSVVITFMEILMYINIFSNVVAIIGLCLYFKKPKAAAIVLTLAVIFNIAVYCYLIYLGGFSNTILFIVSMIPALLIIISTIPAYKYKKPTPNNNYFN